MFAYILPANVFREPLELDSDGFVHASDNTRPAPPAGRPRRASGGVGRKLATCVTSGDWQLITGPVTDQQEQKALDFVVYL